MNLLVILDFQLSLIRRPSFVIHTNMKMKLELVFLRVYLCLRTRYFLRKQHSLYFLPLPHGQSELRLTLRGEAD